MRILPLRILWIILLAIPALAPAQADPANELEALKHELARMRTDYESRIAQLEQRLDAAEQTGTSSQPDNGQANFSPGTESYGNMASTGDRGNSGFNPDLGVIFHGQGWSYSNNPDDYHIPGFPLGGEAGPVPEGLALGEVEINISANVDDKFTAWLTAPLVIEDGEAGIEIEEAWIETLKMPAGLSLRLGRFFSNIGYLNTHHAHSWDFVDQPLPYQVFLGSQYLDDGLQLRWLAPTELYFELGAELTRGEGYPSGGAVNSGVGAYTLRARLGGDLGFSHSWQAGLSYLHADSNDRPAGNEDDPYLFSGDSDLMMAELVWKWAPNGNYKQRNFKFQTEYIHRNEKGSYGLPDDRLLPWNLDQDGWYMQAVYQPVPRWRMGIRYDTLSSDNPAMDFADTALMPGNSNPKRYSVMADWSNSEFSRLRLQYTQDRAGDKDDNQWGLQYVFSIGAHGAHSF
jgi:hypothetical protein